jgi:sugar lactone lactonase YvrE
LAIALPTRPGEIVTLTSPDDVLGECPIWSPEERALYWIDVRAPAIRRLTIPGGERTEWPMPELIGAMSLRRAGGLVVALRTGVAAFDPTQGTMTPIATLHPASGSMRLNDGKCDRQGRFWVGSMDDVSRAAVGTLYRLDGTGCVAMGGGVAVPNSLCWSPDGTVMYFADGVEPVIWAYPFDPATGAIGTRREFARLSAGTGIPDGATVDRSGFLWSANYGGGCVTRSAPDGAVAAVIGMPFSQPTSCAFGGPDMDVLLITSAFQRLSPEQRAAEPLAGAVLALATEAIGLDEPRYEY